MLKNLKYRMYPNKTQQQMLSKAFGCARYAYNWTIGVRSAAYARGEKTPSRFDLGKMMTAHKKQKSWLNDVSDWVLKEAIGHACIAFEKFFSHQAEFPVFKSKKSSRQSASWRQPRKYRYGHIHIPRIGEIKIAEHRPIIGEIKTVTIVKNPSGRYFMFVSVDDGNTCKQKPDVVLSCVGIDVGIKHFCCMSNGGIADIPKSVECCQRKISRLKKRLNRQKRGSNRREKTRIALAREYERMVDRKHAFLHELSSSLIRDNQAIAIEDLNIVGMLKRKSVARSVSESSWGAFFRMLEYKCEWYGVHLLKCGRFEPSTKMCSKCGHIKRNMTLGVRKWECPECGAEHDRDMNAAVNILNFAVASTVNGRGDKVRLEFADGVYPAVEFEHMSVKR